MQTLQKSKHKSVLYCVSLTAHSDMVWLQRALHHRHYRRFTQECSLHCAHPSSSFPLHCTGSLPWAALELLNIQCTAISWRSFMAQSTSQAHTSHFHQHGQCLHVLRADVEGSRGEPGLPSASSGIHKLGYIYSLNDWDALSLHQPVRKVVRIKHWISITNY